MSIMLLELGHTSVQDSHLYTLNCVIDNFLYSFNDWISTYFETQGILPHCLLAEKEANLN